MPALVPYPNVFKVKLRWGLGADQQAITGLHFSWSGTAPTNATCGTIASDIYGFVVSALLGLYSTDNSIEEVVVQDLTSSTSGMGSHTASTAGTRGSGQLTGAVCALLSCQINRRYRGGKPRMYFPFGVPADIQSRQTWEPSFVTAMDTQMAAFIADVLAISVSGCVLGQFVSISYYEGIIVTPPNPITGRVRTIPKPRTAAIAPDPIVSFGFNPNYASQRRRNQVV